MSDTIEIDGKLFHERIAHFINAWKADKRNGDALFTGASSIVVMMGKVEEVPNYNKNNAIHVRPHIHMLTPQRTDTRIG